MIAGCQLLQFCDVLLPGRLAACLVVVALAGALLLVGCATAAPDGAAQTDVPEAEQQAAATLITPDELNEMLKDKDFLLVNTHVPYEGELPDTDVFVPFDDVASNIDKLPKDKSAKIVLYCQSDRMSGIAAEELAQMGYTNLYDLDGGFVAWEEEGYELIHKEQ